MHLPPWTSRYVTEISKDVYNGHAGNQEFPQSVTKIKDNVEIKLIGYMAIVSFYPRHKPNVVIPIPFILDTGAYTWAERQ